MSVRVSVSVSECECECEFKYDWNASVRKCDVSVSVHASNCARVCEFCVLATCMCVWKGIRVTAKISTAFNIRPLPVYSRVS